VPSFKADGAGPDRVLFWEHYGRKAVRRGDWKAVSGEKNKWHLYHLKNDPTELTDLAEEDPAKLEEFKQLWQTWAKRCDVLK
jgi:arylsulfatase